MPKKEKHYREGHLSRFSEMIDQVEKVAIQQLGFKNYMDVLKKCTEQTMYESSAQFIRDQENKPDRYESSDGEDTPKNKRQ